MLILVLALLIRPVPSLQKLSKTNGWGPGRYTGTARLGTARWPQRIKTLIECIISACKSQPKGHPKVTQKGGPKTTGQTQGLSCSVEQLQVMCSGGSKGYTCVRAKSLQLCLTLCNTMDYNLPDSSVHGILQARILDWVAMPSSRGSSWPRDWTRISYISCIGRQVLYY